MSWGRSASQAPTILSFDTAQSIFDKTKPVKSNRWNAHERPLIKRSQAHFKLVKHEDPNYYTAQFYDTDMVRWSEDGRVLVRGFSTSSSYDFLHALGWGYNHTYKSKDGTNIRVPLHTGVNYAWTASNGVVVPESWSASLLMDKNMVDTSRSAHRPVYRRVSTVENKEVRATLMKKMNIALDLMVLRIPSFHGSNPDARQTGIRRGAGRPFYGGGAASVLYPDKILLKKDLLSQKETIDDASMSIILKMAQECYTNLLASRSYNNTYTGMLDGASFKRSIKTALLYVLEINVADGLAPVSQFETPPHRHVYWGKVPVSNS